MHQLAAPVSGVSVRALLPSHGCALFINASPLSAVGCKDPGEKSAGRVPCWNADLGRVPSWNADLFISGVAGIVVAAMCVALACVALLAASSPDAHVAASQRWASESILHNTEALATSHLHIPARTTFLEEVSKQYTPDVASSMNFSVDPW